MKRKFFVTLLVAVLALAMLSPSIASACESRDAQNYRRACAIANVANAQIKALVVAAQLTPYNDVPMLIVSTEAISRTARYQISLLGIESECVYKSYFVDGQWVMIDPLHVINPLPNGGKDDNKPKQDGHE